METTPDDPRAMLHASGKYVVPIMHWKARQKKPDVITAEPEIRSIFARYFSFSFVIFV